MGLFDLFRKKKPESAAPDTGKSKIDPVLKVELVERYLRNEIGINEANI
jgi:hypothetical protein